ncbi:hypothetical protein L2E82_48552 [Cichorium intybus]|uniref:Uncharacterized protein n=1 Tax=Cichorium intybus TaxID=13427 RepID=A0ACB8YYJ4_CICIN|nr:hypothetical protein L2E82_48552 [Cichorium intybus]
MKRLRLPIHNETTIEAPPTDHLPLSPPSTPPIQNDKRDTASHFKFLTLPKFTTHARTRFGNREERQGESKPEPEGERFGNVERSREKEIDVGKPKGRQRKREKKCEAAAAPVLLVVTGNGSTTAYDIYLDHLTETVSNRLYPLIWDNEWNKKTMMCWPNSQKVSGYCLTVGLPQARNAYDMWEIPARSATKALFSSCKKEDTRPLLCFSAGTVPIRALKCSPVPRDPKSTNIIAIAGHKGVRFWDIRCVILSSDDGEIKIINLSNAASDVPVTGTPTVKTQQHGSHSYYCSSSLIWSLQVSRLTGMVAYCCQMLTTKSVEKDPNKNRKPHYLVNLKTQSSLFTR